MLWTYQKVASLAPNSLVLEKGKSLSVLRRWATMGSDGNLLWGECKSSGARHYYTAVRLGDESFRCDCGSRHHPCRHILGLLLYFVKMKALAPGTPPSWAQQLLKEPPPQPPSDEEKARKEEERSRRLGQRLALMEQGALELEEWILDLARHGLSAVEEQPPGFWDGFAARMVDAKLGSVARRIRNFQALAAREDGFERLLEGISELYLLVQAFKQLGSLPDVLQEEALQQMGVNQKKEEVMSAGEAVEDTWLALGQLKGKGESDNLRYRRTWFLGEQSSRMALILDFSWGGQGYDQEWPVGGCTTGELAFYAGAYPLRALFRHHQPSNRPFLGKLGYATINDFAGAYAQALAANPWLAAFPCLLAEVFPARDDDRPWLVDKAGKKIPLLEETAAGWKLLAVSGGRPLQAFGEWDGKALLPLSAVVDGRVVSLQSNVDTASGQDFPGL